MLEQLLCSLQIPIINVIRFSIRKLRVAARSQNTVQQRTHRIANS